MTAYPWLKLHRSIIESDVFADPFRLQGWIYLLSTCATHATRLTLRGLTVDLSPGMSVVSQAEMAEVLGWTRARVRGLLAWLEEQSMVRCTPVLAGRRPVGMVVEVLNWSRYQVQQQASPETKPLKTPVRTKAASSRSTNKQPLTTPVMEPQTPLLRARDSSPEEEERDLVVEERASAPPTPDEDIRAQRCIRPTASVTSDGVIVVQFEAPPQVATRRALSVAGFVYREVLADRRRGIEGRSWWVADDTPARCDLVRRITGRTPEGPPAASRPATMAATPADRRVAPVGLDDDLGAAVRRELRRALGDAELQASFGTCCARSGPDNALQLTFADEMAALLAEKKYRRAVERVLVGLVGPSGRVRFCAPGLDAPSPSQRCTP